MSAAERCATTYRIERWRALSSGVIETAGNTFLLLIAVKWFHAGATAKALVAAGSSVGLMLSPAAVLLIERLRWPPTLGASRFLLVGFLACVVMAAFPTEWVYVPAAIVAMTTASAVIPLMTQVYHDNYPAGERGRLYARAFMLRIGAAIVFAWGAGRFLDAQLDQFRWLLMGFAFAFLFAAVCLRRIPSKPLSSSGGSHPLHALRYVREDRIFRQTLIAWMLMGFANLMMLPLRIEYLGNPRYGLAKSAAEIAVLTGVIPNIARLCLNPVWGRLFDRMNFFALRATLNIGFALGILSFFTSDSMTGLVLSAVIYGISNAGGDVAWGLWVTKFAPPDRVADYMGVHTFLTGVRGVLAPVVAFHAVSRLSLATLGWISASMIVVASLVLLPEIQWRRRGRKADLVMGEVED